MLRGHGMQEKEKTQLTAEAADLRSQLVLLAAALSKVQEAQGSPRTPR